MPVVCTQRLKSRKESEALASCIKRTSFEMYLCFRCKKRNAKCVVFNKENSSRCSKCVLRKASCDAKGIPVSKWQALKLETDCLKRKKEVAFA